MFFLVLVEAAEPVRSQVKLLLVRNLHLNSGLIAVDESLIMIDPKGKSHD
ncbi:MAG: hypothetical protein K1Y36_29280 [Blastocatellia bacterium]|nr:hypothetical protein [Blastocatellia bacterium]